MKLLKRLYNWLYSDIWYSPEYEMWFLKEKNKIVVDKTNKK